MIFSIFWKSVQTKINGFTLFDQHFAFWNLSSSTLFLFEYEFDLPLLSFELAAYLATFGEFFLSLMILLGFMTRFAAMGLMLMTLTIQFFVYPDAWWTVHVFWVVMLLGILLKGSGVISLDHLIKKRIA